MLNIILVVIVVMLVPLFAYLLKDKSIVANKIAKGISHAIAAVSEGDSFFKLNPLTQLSSVLTLYFTYKLIDLVVSIGGWGNLLDPLVGYIREGLLLPTLVVSFGVLVLLFSMIKLSGNTAAKDRIIESLMDEIKDMKAKRTEKV